MCTRITCRLQGELCKVMMHCMQPDCGINAFPASESNLFEWNAHIIGPKGCVYEGRKYRLSISYPEDYPFAAPTVKFTDACFHPNVDQHGNICLDILKVPVILSLMLTLTLDRAGPMGSFFHNNPALVKSAKSAGW